MDCDCESGNVSESCRYLSDCVCCCSCGGEKETVREFKVLRSDVTMFQTFTKDQYTEDLLHIT